MSLDVEIKKMFNEIQRNQGSGLRYCHRLSKLYEKSDYDEFMEYFLDCVKISVRQPSKNLYAHQVVCFAASFSVFVAQKAKRESEELTPTSQETHRFLSRVLWYILQEQNSCDPNIRYHVCLFIAIMLDIVGDDDLLDENICSFIEKIMIERLRDVKPQIRIKAIDTLFRLQDPTNPNCLVVAGFLNSCNDRNADVRRLIIEKISISKYTLETIIGSLSDICEKVRTLAFKKFAVVPPNRLKIAQRQEVLRKGFDEDGKIAKKAFIEVLIPKWISHYDKNFLVFLTAIKLDADDTDIDNTNILSCDIMKEIFKTNEMDDIIKYLPINDNKLIPPEKLSTEVVVYWNRIHQYALKNNIDEVLEIIIPELKPFCEYIKCVLMAFKEDKINIHEWKQLQNEFIITTLFGIARDFDFSDEVGRNSLHDLVIDCIVKLPLKMPLLTILIDILAKMNTSAHNLIEEVNELLSTINDSKQKPFVEELNKTNEEIVKVKEKIESISEELDSMIKQNDMAEAFKLEENMNILKGLLTKLKNEQYVCSPERELFLDEKCLDIQICLLRHRSITISTPTLEQMETRYIQEELGESKKSTLYHKLFECCILYSLNNRKTAKFYAELITLPIRFYQVLEDNDAILVLSIKGFTDLLNIHGPNIFPNVPTNLSGFCSNEKEHQFVKFLIDKLVDMLDDKRKDISETATKAISKLIYFGITVTCQTFCRVLVKWYNPEIINKNPLGCQLFGLAFIRFCQHFKESENIIVNSVIPILSSLSRVSLNDINIDNLIKFLAALSQLRNTEELHLHNVLNFMLCNKILENVNARAVELYVKMLMTLEIPSAQDILDNLKLKVEEIMLELSEGPLKRKIKKYLLKLSSAKVVRETDVNHNNRIRQASQNSDTGETDTPDNYTIHDTDDSVGTPTSLKRSVDLRFSELDDLAVDTVEKTSELFKKKLRLETEKSNEVVENESQNEFNKRTNTTEVQTVSPKITKFE